jgi:hypothetical protein
MHCIAIWCSSAKTKSVSHSLEVHFNLWKLGKGRNAKCFLDIGIMIQDAIKVDHVNIFIPQPVAKPHIEDLGITFRKNPDLVSTLFNEDYRISSGAQEKIVEVLSINKIPIFYIYALDPDSDISIENAFGGSVIKIRISQELADKKHYYRIRLKNPYIDSISHIYTPPNSVLESAFSQTELVDFRINEKRNLNYSLLERIHSEGEVSFSKTHLFLMREASDDYVYSHKPPNDSRQLEADLWKSYIDGDYLFDKMIAYHWKETDTHHSFSAFIKFRYTRCSFWTIVIFLIIIIIIGTLSGLAANFLSSL